MQALRTDSFARYQRWRRFVEPGFWLAFYSMQTVTNGWMAWIEIHFLSLATHMKVWQPMVMLAFSNLVLLVLLPAVIAFNRRYPLRLDTLRRNLPAHFFASLVYCAMHIAISYALITAMFAYKGVGKQLEFGDFWSGVFFQYLKDIRFYLIVIIIVNFYRLVMLRWQGEASLLDAPDTGAPAEEIERPDRFLVRKLGKEFLLPAADIEWMQAQGNYVNLRVRGRDYPLRSTMGDIETRLDPKRFIRVHRSYIVNLNRMRQIEPIESGDALATMDDGSQVPVSRRHLDTLREAAAA